MSPQFRRNFRLRKDVCYSLIDGFAASDECPGISTHGGATPKTAEYHVLSFLWYVPYILNSSSAQPETFTRTGYAGGLHNAVAVANSYGLFTITHSLSYVYVLECFDCTPNHSFVTVHFITSRYAGNKVSIRDVAGRFDVSESCLHAMMRRVMAYLSRTAHRVIRFPDDLEALAGDFQKVRS